MKRILMFIGFIAFSLSASAQKGQTAVGVNLGYGTEIKSLGLGAKAQYNILEALRVEGSFDYFLKKDYVNMWDINANVHYLFPVIEDLKLYPLVGLTYMKISTDLDDIGGLAGWWGSDFSYTRFGVNMGGGAEYAIAENLAINAEIKYQLVSDADQAVFSFGVIYKF